MRQAVFRERQKSHGRWRLLMYLRIIKWRNERIWRGLKTLNAGGAKRLS